MQKSKVKRKTSICILIVLASLLLLIIIALYMAHKNHIIYLSIFGRPHHEAAKKVENVHDLVQFNELESSSLPRIDITMAEDFLLSKEAYTKCTITITHAGEYNLSESEAKIRIRGNTTAYADKKSFKVKFTEKTSLFGGGKEKSWVLISNAADATNIHNYVSFKLYENLAADDAFVSMCNYVDVYANGKYLGLYILCDQVEPGKTRVPINGKIGNTPEETDYLIVQDCRAYYDDGDCGEENVGWFWLEKSNDSFAVKSPDTDKEAYPSEYTMYIKNKMDEIIRAIDSGDYESVQKLVDTDSIINGFLTYIIVRDTDIAKASKYYYLPAGGKLTFGPVWDCDLTFGYGSKRNAPDNPFFNFRINTIFDKLMDIPEFKADFVNRFNEVYPNLETQINAYIDNVLNKHYEELKNDFDFRSTWGRQGTEEVQQIDTYDGQIEYMRQWTHERLTYLYSIYGH